MNYRSIADLNQDIVNNVHRIPRDVDVVVGIPRSGLLAGALVALALNLPLADIDGFSQGRILSAGMTRRRKALDQGFGEMRHALVLDDSIHSGGAMAQARAKLADLPSSIKVTYCAVYGVQQALASADIVFEIVPLPRMFQWNVMHHEILKTACVDIDGVLCADPTAEENDDGERYLGFLNDARPLCLPTKRIATLVTSRLEKYRGSTERWLAENGVEYAKLVMLDLPDAATRRRLNAHASFKGAYYRQDAASLFIESEVEQAIQIARISGKAVLCMADHKIYSPGLLSPIGGLQRFKNSYKVRRLARLVLGSRLIATLKSVVLRSTPA